MDEREFCDRVLARLRHATRTEKAAVRAELEGHIEDRAEALTKAGYDHEAAMARAAEVMGNPEEIGGALDKQYPLGWLILSRVSLIFSILLAVSLVTSLHSVAELRDSVEARTNPAAGLRSGSVTGTYIYSVDLRADVGNDVLRVFQLGLTLRPDGQTGVASVALCNYDQNVFGTASQILIDNTTYETESGGELMPAGGSGGGGSGAQYWVADGIDVSRTDEYLAVCYDRFGETARLEVPLDWEGMLS
ncbi:permease prefix domain 1-containing protein [Oscillibacter ruminantium]|uniref:permease prefix domain 1-containing protein n=1 Tax=Oscillibacter ruminantium TaxID=1263547 RepID=UPI002B20FD82|nr:permease prefix domain 1-containing protein [Oscillibacter ruminantium]MEA5041509.1 permease prefix domain 1-containing protein [Oscillibacter ruminantium]